MNTEATTEALDELPESEEYLIKIKLDGDYLELFLNDKNIEELVEDLTFNVDENLRANGINILLITGKVMIVVPFSESIVTHDWDQPISPGNPLLVESTYKSYRFDGIYGILEWPSIKGAFGAWPEKTDVKE